MKLPKHRRDEAALNSRLIRRPIKRMVWLFLLPTFGAFCIGFLYPFFKGLFLSFCNFRITSQWTCITVSLTLPTRDLSLHRFVQRISFSTTGI